MKKISSKIIQEINPLIEKSFGRGFKGNYDNCCDEENQLLYIAKKNFISYMTFAGLLGVYNHSIYDLDNEKYPFYKKDAIDDGSLIAVYPEYIEQGKKYIELYESLSGKKGTLIVAEEKDLYAERNYFSNHENLSLNTFVIAYSKIYGYDHEHREKNYKIYNPRKKKNEIEIKVTCNHHEHERDYFDADLGLIF
ncbi:Uncharacterised protein [uncultured archaeon]|nr:Uncharacterised protein [uncultured archaeon]